MCSPRFHHITKPLTFSSGHPNISSNFKTSRFISRCHAGLFLIPTQILLFIQFLPPIHLQLSSAIVENEGSFARAIFKLTRPASAGLPAAGIPQIEKVSAAVHALTASHVMPVAYEKLNLLKGFCPLCMNDPETVFEAPCGHGCCRTCWEGLVLVALQDSSTTKVKTGATDLLDVSKLKCHGCS
jgi:hypothetical protein